MGKRIKIPREKLSEGIRLCLNEIRDYLSDAKLLIDKSSLHHAYILVQFACEELGKASILKNKFKESKPGDIVNVKDLLFSDHKYKQDECWNLLGRELQVVYEGCFVGEGFTRQGFEITEFMNSKTRLDAAFVNWNIHEQNWEVFPRIDKEKIQKIINSIESKTVDFFAN